MLAFMLGIVLAYTGATAGLLFLEPNLRAGDPWLWPMLLVVWLLPVFSAWGASETVLAVRGPRLRTFNTVHLNAFGRVARGIVAGLVGLGASLAALVYWNQPPSDAVVMGLGGAVGAAAVLLFERRVKAGECLGCGYDLRGLTEASSGKCPECGMGACRITAREETLRTGRWARK